MFKSYLSDDSQRKLLTLLGFLLFGAFIAHSVVPQWMPDTVDEQCASLFDTPLSRFASEAEWTAAKAAATKMMTSLCEGVGEPPQE
jgi:hypothetical protein